jgi:selenide,water dikinase
VDFFTPIVNDPYLFGQIAAANALSDVYAMGGKPLTAMNILCVSRKMVSGEDLKAIMAGGLDKIHEAGALLVGGHSVEDTELKYGLSITGIVHQPCHQLRGRAGDSLI